MESYRNNTGLDLISGLLRLMLDDFDNADGANRLRSSLSYVKSLENDAKKYILADILWVGTHLKNSSKAILAKELSFYFESIIELKTIYEALRSEHILNIIIGNYNGRLEDINNKLYGELKEVR